MRCAMKRLEGTREVHCRKLFHVINAAPIKFAEQASTGFFAQRRLKYLLVVFVLLNLWILVPRTYFIMFDFTRKDSEVMISFSM